VLAAAAALLCGQPAARPAATAASSSAPASKPAAVLPAAYTLTNGVLEVDVLKPLPESLGKDQRFDWSGRVVLVRHGEHTFFGTVRPGADGAPVKSYTTGTSDEFKTALTMPATAAAGAESQPAQDIRIGIGMRRQKVEQRGKTSRTVWELAEPFDWKVTTGTRFVQFEQSVSRGPWGYVYTKRVELGALGNPQESSLTISRTLQNTGRQEIDTMHYCHNWLRIDGQYIAGQYRLTFPFQPRHTGQLRQSDIDKHAKAVSGNTLNPGGDFWMELGPQASGDNEVQVVNTRTGGSVRIFGDWPPDAFNLYVKPGECCPEPFIHLQLAPGQKRTWTSWYEFGHQAPASAPVTGPA
jgi:hypothetical protein